MKAISFGAGTLLLFILLSGCGAVKTDREWALLEEATAGYTDERIFWEQSGEDKAKIEEEIDRVLRDNVLTRNEAVGVALINNRALQSAFEEIGISKADLVQAGLFHNPGLGMLFRFPFDGDGTNIEMEGSFVLPDLWQMPFRRKVAAAQMDVTIMRVSQVVLDTLMEVKLAYEKVYYLNLERDEVQKMLEKSKEISKETEKRRNFGFMSDLEVYLSQSLASRVEMDLAGTEAEINIARAHLDRILDIGLEHSDYEIEGDVNELPEMPDLNAALQYALEHRPDVQIARLRIKEAERALRLEKIRILKHLDLSASYEKDAEGSEVFGPGVDLQIPIFDQNRASVAKFSYMLRKAERNLQALEGQIKEEIAVDLERVRLYRTKTMTYREKTIPLNQKAIEYAEEWVGAMQLSRLYLLETQKELLQSQKDYLEALIELRHAFLDLELHSGGNLP